MTHQAQLANVKYRNWVKAGLGIKYVKEGLELFCDHLATQQHIDILKKVKKSQKPSEVSCGQCDVRTLQPSHVRTKDKQCPLGQIHCNCQHPGGKMICPDNVCGGIYDEIIKLHASTPPAPYWKNTDARQWCTEPWSVTKCFINAPGYELKTKANEFDCPGLLQMLINNLDFQKHIKCAITGKDVFSRVRESRNAIFHSHTMELEDKEVNSYIDDMIELLEDEEELKHRQESKDAVINLRELKQTNFTISTADEDEILRIAKDAIGELQQIKKDSINEIQTTGAEGKFELEGKGLAIKSEIDQKGENIKTELIMKGAELKENIKHELVIREDESKKKLEQKGIEIEKQLTRKRVEAEEKLQQKLQESTLQLESHKIMIQSSMTSATETSKEAATSKKKADFQEKLVKLYKTHVRKVPPLPRLHKNKRNVSDMYVSPWMTVEIYNEESKRWDEVKISTHQIFKTDEKHANNIYVIGEAGSGKSTFCKMLVHFWYIAHQYQECSLDERDIIEEMKRFNFLFYVSLRHFSDCDSIEEMLKKSYGDPALEDILQNDSGKCLIVLDGLDEWNKETKHSSQFLTPGLLGGELDADYTIITTTRQWKFDALPISDCKVDKKIKLNGIDKNEMIDLTTKTVETLNEIYQKSKNAEECITDLLRRQVSDISHTPLVLQQLVCLWFNDKLQVNSKCAIYKSMLDLFLEWKPLGTSESQEQLYAINTASRNAHVTEYLSYLAYETLFDKNKETTLTFSSATLTQLSIPCDVIKDCLTSGILKEERNVSLTESIQSSISFFHKSMQEYLAAVYIGSRFREMLKLQMDEHDLSDVCEKCVRKYFGRCKTVVDILEQSNVSIILCGLEPHLLTNISEYFYNVTVVDKMVVKERNKIRDRYQMSLDHHTLINYIQACILKCIEEAMLITKNARLRVYIADLYVDLSTDLLRYGHTIVFKNVLSIEIVDSKYNMIGYYKKDETEAFYLGVKHLIKCDQLKVIKSTFNRNTDERIKNEVTTILETNARTLETIHLRNTGNDIIMVTRLVSILPKMRQLISLKVDSGSYGSGLTHDDNVSLCKFLEQTKSLQHISLDISCSKGDKHMIDLSKHKQLQHVDFRSSSLCMVSCNTDNLETCELNITSVDMMTQACCSLYKADKLKHLGLLSCLFIWSNVTDTESLTRLLPSLVSLSTLTLWDFTFTDNIIARPCDMKNLKEITLKYVKMSIPTWRKFIDSLPELPQVVTVKTRRMDIGYVNSMSNMFKKTTAHQYVTEKTSLFRVTNDRYGDFQFTTKK